ncbi:MAG: sulfatase [Myxococcota bacterium]
MISSISVQAAEPASSAQSAAAKAPAKSPNILLLFAEDMSSRVGAFGDPVAVTPNLDRLAEEGVRFTNVFAGASTCGPSRAALLTGVHAIATGSQHMRTSSRPAGAYRSVPPPQIKAFPERLRAAGYYTFTDGKLDYQWSGVRAGSGPFTMWDEESSGRRWSGRRAGQPFFGLINFMSTHESGNFPALGSMPHSIMHFATQWMHFFGDYEIGVGPVRAESVSVPAYYPDTPTVRSDMARLYNNIFQMDAQVGAILDQLDREGLADETIVIWTTDHGEGLPRAKRSLHDAGLRVPMIIRWPEALRPKHLERGAEEKRLISLVDLAATIDGLAYVKTPPWVQGQDFLQPNSAREWIFATQDRVDDLFDRQRTVRDDRFVYIRSEAPELPIAAANDFRENLPMMREISALHEAGSLGANSSTLFDPVGEERLYDRESDPDEFVNLAGQPEWAPRLRRMSEALDGWLARMGPLAAMPEEEMVASFQAEGEPRVTRPPKMRAKGGRVLIQAPDAGASIGYRIAHPSAPSVDAWSLYTEPIFVAPGSEVSAKAVRYGWDESEIVERSFSAEALQALEALQVHSGSAP